MQKFSLMLESQNQAEEVLHLIWDTWGVRGEIEIVPMEEKSKVHVIAEKDLSVQQLDQLPGKKS